MQVVGKLGSYISRSVYTVSGPFHPFGGAVDIIVVEQQDGSFKSSPWYVRFGKFQGVLKAREKVVSISVDDVEADFNMYLDHKGEAYFLKEVDGEEVDELSSPSSSGEDTDGQSDDRRPMKSKSYNYDAYESKELAQIDLSNGNVIARTSSRRSRIMGLVFGRKSLKKNSLPEEGIDAGVIRSESLERAEIAADLLEVKWSTNLASPKQRKDNTSRLSSQHKLEASDSEDLLVKDGQNNVDFPVSDKKMDDSDNSILYGGGSEQVYAETAQTTGLTCQVNAQAETGFNAEEPSSVGEILENKNDGVFPLDRITPENAIISSSSVENGFVTETYSQTVTVEPVYGCGQCIESQSIVTISTFSNSTCEALVEETVSGEDEIRQYESPMMKPVGGPILLNILTSEISEEEQLLFGEFDDLKYSPVRDTEEPVSPEYDVKVGDPQLSKTETGKDFRGRLKPVSSHINIPATSGAQSEAAFRHAKSLPNISSYNYEQCANDHSQCLNQPIDPGSKSLIKNNSLSNIKKEEAIDNQKSEIAQTAEDAKTIEKLKNGLANPAADATNGEIGTEDEKDLPKSKKIKKKTRSITPTSEQLASLNLKEGRNSVVFTFSTPMLGKQQVDARIYLWKWDARVVISDVDGTITRSDLLGQVMPWVGVDWSQTGVAHLFSAIKENGYQLLFLSARAISQAYHTRQFLVNLKQDGKVLPEGPVVISPDGLFSSLYREVVRRAPHEFKIACLEDIKALFPSDRNPFYAGFGNRDTDEISYLKVGIPKGKIFIINPKGEIVVNRRVDTKTYTSLHALVHDMFPPTSSSEQEDFNSWNYWKIPPPAIDI